MQPLSRALALRTAAAYAVFPEVEAVALVGSQTDLLSDADSDLNLAIFLAFPLDLAVRQAVVEGFARRGEGLDPVHAYSHDTWFDKATGRCVDVRFYIQHEVSEHVTELLERTPSTSSYVSTTLLHLVSSCEILFDRSFWLENMRGFVARPYPEALRRTVLEHHLPFVVPGPRSLLRHLEVAKKRHDDLSLIAASAEFMRHYFQVLFALNGVYFPGTKQLVHQTLSRCELLPKDFHTLFQYVGEASTPDFTQVAREASQALTVLVKEHLDLPTLL